MLPLVKLDHPWLGAAVAFGFSHETSTQVPAYAVPVLSGSSAAQAARRIIPASAVLLAARLLCVLRYLLMVLISLLSPFLLMWGLVFVTARSCLLGCRGGSFKG